MRYSILTLHRSRQSSDGFQPLCRMFIVTTAGSRRYFMDTTALLLRCGTAEAVVDGAAESVVGDELGVDGVKVLRIEAVHGGKEACRRFA